MNDMETLLRDFKEVLNECERYRYIARGKEYQQESISGLIELRKKITASKENMIEVNSEDYANTLLSLEMLVDAVINELHLWIYLKEDNPNKAWDSLVEAQSSVRLSLQAHKIASEFGADKFAMKLYLTEHLLFPIQMFLSPGMVINSAECSICGKEYGDCDHTVGKAYMGKMCFRIIKSTTLMEISLVEDPANKHARVTKITDKGARDYMTWRPVAE